MVTAKLASNFIAQALIFLLWEKMPARVNPKNKIPARVNPKNKIPARVIPKKSYYSRPPVIGVTRTFFPFCNIIITIQNALTSCPLFFSF